MYGGDVNAIGENSMATKVASFGALKAEFERYVSEIRYCTSTTGPARGS